MSTEGVEHEAEFIELRIRIDELDKRFALVIDGLTARVFQQFNSDHTALQAAMVSQERAVAAALQAAKEAVDKAEVAASKRFDSTNEFRLQLADQQATFVRSDVADARFAAVSARTDALAEQVTALQLAQASGHGRDTGTADLGITQRAVTQGRYMLVSACIAGLALTSGVVALIIHG